MVHIRFHELHVNKVSNSSGIFSGDNRLLQWRSDKKMNQGFGTIQGDKNKASDHIHTVIHSDTKK